MTARTVTSHAELDAALTDPTVTGQIWIDSPKHVGIVLSDTRGKWVGATGNATIERATGNATIKRATGNATIERADGNATIERATGNATIKWADGNATIKCATGCTVLHHVDGEANVNHAGSLVTVYLYSARATVAGGRIIDLTTVDFSDAATWAEHQGAPVTRGRMTVYKAVDAGLKSGHGTAYPIGTTVTAPDWADTNACGSGLHFGPTPMHALDYIHCDLDEARFLEVTIPVKDARGITDGGTAKIKAKSCRVVREVDRFGEPITADAEQVAS